MRLATVKLWVTALGAAAIGAALAVTALPVSGQAPRPAIPRTADGKPDLNGIWQALNTANWDIEAHTARPALAMRPGPVVPVPAKEVRGARRRRRRAVRASASSTAARFPTCPRRRKKKDENQAKWLTRDPEIKCYLPGVPRATYMPFPFQIFQSQSAFFIAYEYAGAVRNIYLKDPGPPQVDIVDGPVGRPVGRRHVRRRRPTASTTRAGSIAPATTTARR